MSSDLTEAIDSEQAVNPGDAPIMLSYTKSNIIIPVYAFTYNRVQNMNKKGFKDNGPITKLSLFKS